MRNAAVIVAALLLLGTAAMGFLGSTRTAQDAGAVAFALLGLLSLATLCVVLLENSIVPHMAIATVATAALVVVLNPSDGPEVGTVSARTMAYVVSVLAALGAAAACGARTYKA